MVKQKSVMLFRFWFKPLDGDYVFISGRSLGLGVEVGGRNEFCLGHVESELLREEP
jgi:hypothetical protein